LVDVALGRLDPCAPAPKGLEGEAREHAALVAQEIDAATVARPRPGDELDLALVRRQLMRLTGLDVDDVERVVGVGPELEADELRPVRRPVRGEGIHPLPEHVPRLALTLAPDEDLAVLRPARVCREGEARPARRPG